MPDHLAPFLRPSEPFGGRIAFLLNPAAGNGAAARQRPALEAAVAASGLDAVVHVSAGADRTGPLATLLAGSVDAVVAVGGDGTVHDVANALAGTPTRFGVLPLGTGNDFARAVGMPRGIAAGVRALATAVSQPLDVGSVRWADGRGEAQHRVVVNALGVGFDAAAAARAAGFKALGGRAAYLAAVVQELWAWRRPGVEVEVALDDAVAGDGLPVGAGGRVVYAGPLFLCEVGNGQAVGGGFRLTPDARLDDGLLDVCVVRHVRPRRVLRVLPTAFTGGHVRFPEVEMHRAVRVAVRATAGAMGVHSDGEATSAAALALDVEAWPSALHVLVPRPDASA